MYNGIGQKLRDWDKLNLIDCLNEILEYMENLREHSDCSEEIYIYREGARYIRTKVVLDLKIDWDDFDLKIGHDLYLSEQTSLEYHRKSMSSKRKREIIRDFRNNYLYDMKHLIRKLELDISNANI